MSGWYCVVLSSVEAVKWGEWRKMIHDAMNATEQSDTLTDICWFTDTAYYSVAHSVLQMSQDAPLSVLHSGTQSNDIMSLCHTFCVADVTFCVHSVLQMSQDLPLSVLHSGTQSNDIMSLCDTFCVADVTRSVSVSITQWFTVKWHNVIVWHNCYWVWGQHKLSDERCFCIKVSNGCNVVLYV